MSLSELVGELKGKPEKKIDEVQLETELKGQVTPEGEIKLDTADIDVVTARLKEVRLKQAVLKKEESQLKTLLMSHPEAKAGFANSSISIEGTQTIDLAHGPLLAALIETKTFSQACNNPALSQPKVREIAAKKPSVAAAIKILHGRKIKTVK